MKTTPVVNPAARRAGLRLGIVGGRLAVPWMDRSCTLRGRASLTPTRFQSSMPQHWTWRTATESSSSPSAAPAPRLWRPASSLAPSSGFSLFFRRQTYDCLLASDGRNIGHRYRTIGQAASHFHSLPTHALELVLIINLIDFPMADQNILGAA